jgi:uncharacterized membrane protein (UPF0182 family)
VSRSWQTLLLWENQQSFGQNRPVFGHDIGFYVFVLPAIATLLGILAAAGFDTACAFLLGRYDQLRATGQLDREDLTFWNKLGMMVTPGLNYALTLMGLSLIGETFIAATTCSSRRTSSRVFASARSTWISSVSSRR